MRQQRALKSFSTHNTSANDHTCLLLQLVCDHTVIRSLDLFGLFSNHFDPQCIQSPSRAEVGNIAG